MEYAMTTPIKLLTREELELRLETALDELKQSNSELEKLHYEYRYLIDKNHELKQALDELEKRMYD